MFFVVNSGNRHAVRKALTALGMDSAEVRILRNGQLGKALFESVQSGKISKERAQEIVGANATSPEEVEAEPSEFPVTVDPASPIAAPAPASTDDATALAALLARLTRAPAVDPETVRKMVADAIKVERIKPAIVEIKCGELTTKVDGESMHEKFDTIAKVVNTRIDGRRLHVWLVGPSGSGKSYLQSQVAKAVGLNYYSTGAIQSKYDLIGFVPPAYQGKLEECPALLTPFRRAFQFGGLFGWDDVDGSDSRAFVAFNEALSNGRYAFPDAMIEQHPDFVAVASANTWGTGATADYVGRNKIDAATLTRFVRIEVGYDEKLERSLVGSDGAEWAQFVQSIRKGVQSEGVKVLITPRHTLQGAALLKAGLPRREVERMTVFAGLDKATESKVRAAA